MKVKRREVNKGYSLSLYEQNGNIKVEFREKNLREGWYRKEFPLTQKGLEDANNLFDKLNK